jgi:predicted nucleic acid-binding protein
MITNKKIFIDTAPLIYYIEEHKDYLSYLNLLFENLTKNNNTIFTSVITLLEVLVLPYKNNNPELANKYKEILENSNDIHLYSVTAEISKNAASLRAKYNIRTPDSIQFATAIMTQADTFLTNDISLKKISEIETIILNEEIKKSGRIT